CRGFTTAGRRRLYGVGTGHPGVVESAFPPETTIQETTMTAIPTTDNPVGHDVAREARDVLEVLDGGGIAIIPLNVAYAILGRTEGAIRRIFEVKRRSYDKPSGMFGGAAASADLHLLDDEACAMRTALIEEADLPFSIVAEYRRDHS